MQENKAEQGNTPKTDEMSPALKKSFLAETMCDIYIELHTFDGVES